MVKEDHRVSQQENAKTKSSFFGLQSRRRLLLRFAEATAVGGILETIEHWEQLFSFAQRATEGVKKAQTIKTELTTILNSLATEKELLNGVYRNGEQLDLDKLQDQFSVGMEVEVFGMGDSNFYTDGEKNDTLGPNHLANPDTQPNSFLQQAGSSLQPPDTQTTPLQESGIQSWTTHTYAVPGAPSGTGFENDPSHRQYGLIGPEQIGNPDFQYRLRYGNQLKVVNIGVHGDDWRELAKDAFELATIFKSIDIKNLDNISDSQIAELKKLKGRSDEIAAKYGKHIQDALATIGKINEERIAEGLPPIKVVINYPVSMKGVDHIPFRTIAGDEKTHPELSKMIKQVPDKRDRYYLDLNEIPSGRDIAYIITDSIYKQLNTVLPQSAKANPNLDIYSIVWMGLEKQHDLFFIDGHLNEKGIRRIASLFLHLFKKNHPKWKPYFS